MNSGGINPSVIRCGYANLFQSDIFIIEWSEMRTFFNNSIETFQLILYDSGWQTPTGDDEMKIQFKEFNINSV